LIYLFNRVEPYHALLDRLFRECQAGARTIVLSVISEAEMLVKPLREDDTLQVELIETLFQEPEHVEVCPVDRKVARQAAQLRARLGLRLDDAFIVATAVEAGCDALVGNDALCARRVADVPYLYLDEMFS
jgi:predicted nucleic acid-binding protein